MSKISQNDSRLEQAREALDQNVEGALEGLQGVWSILDMLLPGEEEDDEETDGGRSALSGEAECYIQRKQHQCRRIITLAVAFLEPLSDDLTALSRQASI